MPLSSARAVCGENKASAVKAEHRSAGARSKCCFSWSSPFSHLVVSVSLVGSATSECSIGQSLLQHRFAVLHMTKKAIAEVRFLRAASLVEPGLCRTIEAQQGVPARTRDRLHPVLFPAPAGAFGPKKTSTELSAFTLRPSVWLPTVRMLVSLDHRACLIVVEDDRPEILDRNIRRQMQLVRLPPVKRIALEVDEGCHVLRAFANGS